MATNFEPVPIGLADDPLDETDPQQAALMASSLRSAAGDSPRRTSTRLDGPVAERAAQLRLVLLDVDPLV